MSAYFDVGSVVDISDDERSASTFEVMHLKIISGFCLRFSQRY